MPYLNNVGYCDALGDMNVWGTMFQLQEPVSNIIMLATKVWTQLFNPVLLNILLFDLIITSIKNQLYKLWNEVGTSFQVVTDFMKDVGMSTSSCHPCSIMIFFVYFLALPSLLHFCPFCVITKTSWYPLAVLLHV